MYPWGGEAPVRGQDIGNTFGGGARVYRNLARATENVCLPSVVLFPIQRCETSASSLKRAKRRQSSRYLFWPAYNASPQREPSIFCMPPVTYVLAMFVTYVL